MSCCTGAPSRATTAPPVPHRHESDVSEELTHRAQPAAVLLFLRQAMQHCRRLSTACCGSAGQRGRYYTTEKRRWPPERRDDGPQNSVFGFETGVGSGRPWPDPAGDLGGVECCLAHHSEMSLVVHRRVDAGIKSIGWNLDVWTKVGQRPISKFQNDANLGRQLGTFATGPDRRWLNDVLGEGKEAPRFNGKIRRCSPVLLFSCPG